MVLVPDRSDYSSIFSKEKSLSLYEKEVHQFALPSLFTYALNSVRTFSPLSEALGWCLPIPSGSFKQEC